MAARKRYRPEKDPILRRARYAIARARREIENVMARRPPPQRGAAAKHCPTMTHDRRRRIIGLIADLDLAIRAMRARRDELGEQAGIAFHRRKAISAYHRATLLMPPTKYARR